MGASTDCKSTNTAPANHLCSVSTRASEEKTVEEAASIARAKRTVLTLLGPTGKITKTEFDPVTGELRALEASHEVGTKIAPSGYRKPNRAHSFRVAVRGAGARNGSWRRTQFDSRCARTSKRTCGTPLQFFPMTTPLINYDSVKIPYGIDEDGHVM